MYSYAYYLTVCMLVMVLSIYYGCMEKGKTTFCVKIGIVMPLLIFNIQCTNLGRVFYFNELSSFYSKSEILFVLSSITKKGEIESASRPLIDFGD
jgi:hypothetical protein